MKVCIIQPKYSADWNDSEKLFKVTLYQLVSDPCTPCDKAILLISENSEVKAVYRYKAPDDFFITLKKLYLRKLKSYRGYSAFYRFFNRCHLYLLSV